MKKQIVLKSESLTIDADKINKDKIFVFIARAGKKGILIADSYQSNNYKAHSLDETISFGNGWESRMMKSQPVKLWVKEFPGFTFYQLDTFEELINFIQS